MAQIQTRCSACGTTAKTSADRIGTRVRCRKCQAVFSVEPIPDSAPPPERNPRPQIAAGRRDARTSALTAESDTGGGLLDTLRRPKVAASVASGLVLFLLLFLSVKLFAMLCTIAVFAACAWAYIQSMGKKSPFMPASPTDITEGSPTVPAATASRTTTCPFCAETIIATAKKCRHCGELLDSVLRAEAGQQPVKKGLVGTLLVVAVLFGTCCGLPWYVMNQSAEEARQAAERARAELQEADKLYDADKKGEAVARYKANFPHSQNKREVLKRIVEFEVAKGNETEAASWIVRGLDGRVEVNVDTPAARSLLARVEREREAKLAEAAKQQEEQAKKKQEEREEREKKKNAPPEAEMKTYASTMMASYKENEVNADLKYKNKIVEVEGNVKSIGKDVLDTSYITLDTEGQTLVFSVQCFFPKKRETDLASLRKGQAVTIRGKCKGKFANILIENCYLISK